LGVWMGNKKKAGKEAEVSGTRGEKFLDSWATDKTKGGRVKNKQVTRLGTASTLPTAQDGRACWEELLGACLHCF